MTPPPDIRQQALRLITQLTEQQLPQALAFLETLHQRDSIQDGSATENLSEAALLQMIQRRLAPADQARLDELRQRNEAETITEAEYQELLAYVEQIEQQDADRAAALIQLARLRQVDLKTLANQFLTMRQSA